MPFLLFQVTENTIRKETQGDGELQIESDRVMIELAAYETCEVELGWQDDHHD